MTADLQQLIGRPVNQILSHASQDRTPLRSVAVESTQSAFPKEAVGVCNF